MIVERTPAGAPHGPAGPPGPVSDLRNKADEGRGPGGPPHEGR
jgi:hypothetical protein